MAASSDVVWTMAAALVGGLFGVSMMLAQAVDHIPLGLSIGFFALLMLLGVCLLVFA